jgi:hypothetical protein
MVFVFPVYCSQQPSIKLPDGQAVVPFRIFALPGPAHPEVTRCSSCCASELSRAGIIRAARNMFFRSASNVSSNGTAHRIPQQERELGALGDNLEENERERKDGGPLAALTSLAGLGRRGQRNNRWQLDAKFRMRGWRSQPSRMSSVSNRGG